MLKWFIASSTVIKTVIIGSSVLLIALVTAIPTALIASNLASNSSQNTDLTQKPQSSGTVAATSGGTSSPKSGQSASPTAAPVDSSKESDSPSKSSTNVQQQQPEVASGPTISVPSAPTNFQTGGGGCYSDGTTSFCGVSFTFTPPSSDGGAVITGYIANYSNDGGATWQTTGTQYQDSYSSWETTPVAGNGIPIMWFIQAVNSAGLSPASNVDSLGN